MVTPPPELNTLGKRISVARQALGISQTALAKMVGCSSQAISKWENDEGQTIRQPLFLKLCQALKVNTHWLNGGEIDPTPYRKVSIDEAALLDSYRALSDAARDKLATFATFLVRESQAAPSLTDPFPKAKRAAKPPPRTVER